MAPREDEMLDPLELKDPESLHAYRGKVVAILDGEIKASADTWKEAFRAADEAGLQDPLFHYVPAYPVIGPR